MKPGFTERAPYERGFAQVFDQRIVPDLERLEAERQMLFRKARLYAAVPVGLAALLALGFASGGDTLVEMVVGAALPLVFGGLAAFGIWKLFDRRWGGSVAEAVMPAICDFVGELSYDPRGGAFPLERMRELKVVPGHNRRTLTDRLTGRYRDTAFELVEARLVQRSSGGRNKSSSSRTVFRGLFFRIGVPEPVSARILIARDKGQVGNKVGEFFSGLFGGSGRGMPKVPLPHERFESAFEVYSDDPDTAYRVLDPAFLDNLLAIGESEGGRKGSGALTAAFEAESFFMALEREGDFLAMGSLARPIVGIEEDLHGVFDDLALVYRIIDRLHGVHPELATAPAEPA